MRAAHTMRPLPVSLCVLATCANSLFAQPVKRLALAPVAATLGAEFVGITSVREIADGRVIVTDGRDQTLYLADFRANTASQLGTKGKGPGEWTMVGFVHAIGGDSTIMSDMMQRRWLLMDGAKIVGTVPPDQPAVKITNSIIGGTDNSGHVMTTRGAPTRNGVTEVTRKDSTALVFVDRATGHTDTIAKLREMPRKIVIDMDAEGRIHSSSSAPTEANAQREEAVLSHDGWLAVIRLEPLRVDWRSPSGQWTKGAPFALKPEGVDERERKAINQRYATYVADMKKAGLPVQPQSEIPAALPVMASFRFLQMASDGRLLIRRTSSATSPAVRWLVVNRRGTIDGEFVLGPKEDIAGFGAKSIYISSKDADDVQTLRRHPWP